ncbi:MAG: hypothetical protein Q8N09_02075 [Thermodesulfovibrionia bacterium]|nr:hypothetical protein [Thermodesulfovibrionia bacterium]
MKLNLYNGYLLLDEPLSSLHEGMKRELWFLIKELQQRYGLTIVMVTHDMEEAFFLGDRISVMIDGVIRQTGTINKRNKKRGKNFAPSFFTIFLFRIKFSY